MGNQVGFTGEGAAYPGCNRGTSKTNSMKVVGKGGDAIDSNPNIIPKNGIASA
jgi:hypothetical protein